MRFLFILGFLRMGEVGHGNAARRRKRHRGIFANLFSIFACFSPVAGLSDKIGDRREEGRDKGLASSSGRKSRDLDRDEQQQQIILPSMSQSSSLISQELQSVLHSALPTLARHRHWLLLYSTWRDGISLLTLYRKSSTVIGHCLLAVADTTGTVFGALLSAPLNPSTTKKYQGDANTFVFTTVSGAPQVFHSTGANRYYVLCTNEALALGGGGHFALYLDNDLQNGSSGESQTFGNTCLAYADEFKLKDVELWGFQRN
ncbi:oxidation resistance protein 1-like isoform X1 [Selaginella moellendorffii]|nr:oxidation resistance protein 1-like isoform X1 [Selaginella moellendorffii]|eukprot:XP_024518240.1 oxidation resistance protein 1-like isoform X1 [Selaginella moellendorffii]